MFLAATWQSVKQKVAESFLSEERKKYKTAITSIGDGVISTDANGKIDISDSILNKPGRLTEEEWNQIRRHPDIGYRILRSSKELGNLADYVMAHHERFDGTGYPKGLKGDDLLIAGYKEWTYR